MQVKHCRAGPFRACRVWPTGKQGHLVLCCYLLAGLPAFDLACQANRLVLMKSVVSNLLHIPPQHTRPITTTALSQSAALFSTYLCIIEGQTGGLQEDGQHPTSVHDSDEVVDVLLPVAVVAPLNVV